MDLYINKSLIFILYFITISILKWKIQYQISGKKYRTVNLNIHENDKIEIEHNEI